MQQQNNGTPNPGTPELDHKYLTVWVQNQLYGFPVSNVIQIIGVPEIVPVPEFPGYAKGVTNLRGAIIPVVDLSVCLGMETTTYQDRTCAIITQIQGQQIGFLVDSVEEVANILPEDISPVPPMGGAKYRYVDGVCKLGERIALRLSTEQLLGAKELAELRV